MRTLVLLAVLATATAARAEDRLIGVDDDGARAYVLTRGGGWQLATVDLDRGTTVDRWTASADNADARNGSFALIQFAPVDGTLAGDLVRFAAIIARTAPASRAHGENGQRTATGHVYQDGSTVELADAAGEHVASLGPGYAPKVSPDGRRVLWSTADNHLMVALAKPGVTPTALPVRQYLIAAQWSVDGKAVLALSRDDHCVYRFPIVTWKAKKLYCDATAGLNGIAQDPSGKTLAVGATGGRAAPSVVWLDARTGKVRATRRLTGHLSYDAEDQSLGPDGLFIALDQNSHLLAIDLRTGAQLDDAGAYEGVRATRWRGSQVVLLRDLRDPVRVDVRALLDAAPATDD